MPNYGIIRRLLARKVGIDISSIIGVAFIGFTLTQTCTTLWRHCKTVALRCASWVTSSIALKDSESVARDVALWAAENLSQGTSRHLSATSGEQTGALMGIEDDDYGFLQIRRPPRTITKEVDQFDDVTGRCPFQSICYHRVEQENCPFFVRTMARSHTAWDGIVFFPQAQG